MSDRLKLAFDQASRLEEVEQDAFADFLLAELRDEAEWRRRFAGSQGVLSALAEEGRAALRSGA
ncbi:MAG TPA: hypothetical protein VK934_05535 [Fimbriimonas sp.]|nr:hypothetical protein [Fimbriimonas sp.]